MLARKEATTTAAGVTIKPPDNMNTPEQRMIDLADLMPSPTNPRKHFDEEKLAALSETIKSLGVLQPLVVRESKQSSFVFEIVAGERRFRAAGLAGIQEVPCVIRELTDEEVLEIQLVENLQRDDLTPLEEAAGYDSLLKLPAYTPKLIAEKVRKTTMTVLNRLSLLKLSEFGMASLNAGKIKPTVGAMLGRIPSPKQREKAEREVVAGDYRGDPLDQESVRRLIADRYMKSLQRSPFELTKPEILPGVGACVDCPHHSSNVAADLNEKPPRVPTCANPECFEKKAAATFKEKAAAIVERSGARLVTDQEEREKIFPPHSLSTEPNYGSGYVDLSTRPDRDLVKAEVERLPTWRALLTDAARVVPEAPERLVVQDGRGNARELVRVRDAMKVIKAAGDPIFKDATSKGPLSPEAKQRKKEASEREERLAGCYRALKLFDAKLETVIKDVDLWQGLLEQAIHHAGNDGCWLICKARGWKVEGGSASTSIRPHAHALSSAEQARLVPVLLIASGMKYNGTKSEGTTELAAAIDLDLEASVEAAKPKRSAATRMTPEERSDIEKRIGAGESLRTIQAATGVSRPTISKIKKQLAAAA